MPAASAPARSGTITSRALAEPRSMTLWIISRSTGSSVPCRSLSIVRYLKSSRAAKSLRSSGFARRQPQQQAPQRQQRRERPCPPHAAHPRAPRASGTGIAGRATSGATRGRIARAAGRSPRRPRNPTSPTASTHARVTIRIAQIFIRFVTSSTVTSIRSGWETSRCSLIAAGSFILSRWRRRTRFSERIPASVPENRKEITRQNASASAVIFLLPLLLQPGSFTSITSSTPRRELRRTLDPDLVDLEHVPTRGMLPVAVENEARRLYRPHPPRA